MSEKAEFQGDVGQAVLGNVNEAPRLKNVVQLNIGKDDSKPPPITQLQRRLIANKVNELMALGNLKRLDIYSVILSDFGAEKMAELPRDRYKDVMTLLDGWIAELRPETEKHDDTHEQAAAEELHHAEAITCAACAVHEKRAKHARTVMMFQSAAMVIIIGISSWLLLAQPADANAAPENYCHLDGKTYSVGSTVKMDFAGSRECIQSIDGAAPHWSQPQKTRARQ